MRSSSSEKEKNDPAKLAMASELLEPGYTLVIAEKPDAGLRIANALGVSKRIRLGNVDALDVHDSFNGEHYVVCAAAGHLYGVADPRNNRSTYPVFDVEWLPLNVIYASRKRSRTPRSSGPARLSAFARNRIEAIRALSRHAGRYVQACDYDLEGETIGFNILKFACALRSWETCKRARFSTLTESEVKESFSHLEPMNESLAQAGRTRHIVDFLWGVNLSRALSGAYVRSGQGYRNITIGRVQGPTLSFVVDREVEIKTHVPLPFWRVFASLKKNGTSFESQYEKYRIDTKQDADAVIEDISSEKSATVKSLQHSTFRVPPPFPFSLGDLQSESFRRYGLSPSMTLKIAERLYIRALISYPRTNSQKLPESIGYQRIIHAISSDPEYRELAEDVLRAGRHYPRQGPKEDAAHPAIYPTGEPAGKLHAVERKIYDLVVRRFLAAFLEDALISETIAGFSIASYTFGASGRKVVRQEWMKVYPTKWEDAGIKLPLLNEGDILEVVSTRLESELDRKPQRFTLSSLLQSMEAQELGTKATRSEIIATLIDREYMIQGMSGNLEASEIGLQLVQAMRKHCEEIVSVKLTRSIESEIERISQGGEDKSVALHHAKEAVSSAIEKIRMSEKDVGLELAEAAVRSREDAPRIGKCPECSNGHLRIVKSPRTGKRFMGCSDFEKGCKASAPLPQKGAIRVQKRTCPTCKWPMISVFMRGRRTPWVLCPNLSCPSRKSK